MNYKCGLEASRRRWAYYGAWIPCRWIPHWALRRKARYFSITMLCSWPRLRIIQGHPKATRMQRRAAAIWQWCLVYFPSLEILRNRENSIWKSIDLQRVINSLHETCKWNQIMHLRVKRCSGNNLHSQNPQMLPYWPSNLSAPPDHSSI